MHSPIIQTGDPVLRQKAKAILLKEIGSHKLNAVITDMKKTLSEEEFGVAIAAPQIAVSLRLFVVAGRIFDEDEEDTSTESSSGKASDVAGSATDLSSSPGGDSHSSDQVFINPEITRVSKKKKEMSEGCLSVRGKYGTVLRHEKVTLKALNEKGEKVQYHANGILAQIFQHECDHLDGTLFTDKAESLDDWKH